MKGDLWHYPRTELARQYLDSFRTGLANRLALFAPRRMGKTEFLALDLAPEAIRRRHFVIYASFWGDINAPQHVLLEALEEGIKASRKKRFSLRSLIEPTIKRVRVESGLGLAAEVELADTPSVLSKSELVQVQRLLKFLAKKRPGKVLLLLDEVQHLTTCHEFDPLQYALRTTLDSLHNQINVVFTGSSRQGMRRMFGDNKMPFYQFATQLEFPNLEREFIAFLGKTYKHVTRRRLNENAVWQYFKRLSYNPFYLANILKQLVLNPALSLDEAYQKVFDALTIQGNYKHKWRQMKPLDRLVYLAIADSSASHTKGRLYAKDRLNELSKALGSKITPPIMQKSIGRLLARSMVSSGEHHGQYVTELPGFSEWCLQQRRAEGAAKK